MFSNYIFLIKPTYGVFSWKDYLFKFFIKVVEEESGPRSPSLVHARKLHRKILRLE